MPDHDAHAPSAEEIALDERDGALVKAVDAEMARARAVAGPLFRCGPGRGECCQRPFPVNRLDARRLQRGLALLGRVDPERARALRERAEAAVSRLRPGFPGDAEIGLLGGDEDARRRFCMEHWDLTCPALDTATGRCELYEWRPLACRAMGTPVRFRGRNLASCGICFGPASDEARERCQAVPDPEGKEDAIVSEVEARSGRTGETFIAFALADRPRPFR